MTRDNQHEHRGRMRPGSRDQDGRKGAMEEERDVSNSSAPGLDDNGMPNDENAIAQDAVGARSDGSQG